MRKLQAMFCLADKKMAYFVCFVWAFATMWYLILSQADPDPEAVRPKQKSSFRPQRVRVVDTFSQDNFTQPIHILLWNKAYANYLYRKGNADFTECPHSNCHITHDRKSRYDVVVFHGIQDASLRHDQLVHLRDQSNAIFIFQVREPPPLTGRPGKWSDHFFNLTMTYRRDSDIDNGWAKVTRKPLPEDKGNYKPWLKRNNDKGLFQENHMPLNTSNVATWIVSNCLTHSKREDYASQINKLMKIKIYGECVKNHIPLESNSIIGRSKMYQKYLNGTYFYLAFENSDHCVDYISEKFYFALNSTAVPVVYGTDPVAYDLVAPTYSFIHADKFRSARELVNYLQYLVETPKAYNQYLKWKKDFDVHLNRPQCNLCSKLNEILIAKTFDLGETSSKYANFSSYWYDNKCKNVDRKWSKKSEKNLFTWFRPEHS